MEQNSLRDTARAMGDLAGVVLKNAIELDKLHTLRATVLIPHNRRQLEDAGFGVIVEIAERSQP